jgi:polar amino acid transport system substrate-binding protein/cystine transport system substrate-binding protein/membrane-bound lytic murein transglycosylase F
MNGGRRPRWVGDAVTIAGIVALFAVLYLLPADTSLSQVRQAGILRLCVPTLYPPLVTGKADAPGFDIEFAQAVAGRLEVRLVINTNPAMGRDFNPRNWNVTRAQCQMLAGGVIVSDLTRSFLDTTPPHLETGWAIVAKAIPKKLDGLKVGFYSGLVGLDRVALSRFFQAEKARIEIVASAQALAESLRAGRIEAGVSEAFTARQIAGMIDAQVAWLPESLSHYPVAFGLWKGDLTLKRRLIAIIDALEREGLSRDLARKYRIIPVEKTFGGA